MLANAIRWTLVDSGTFDSPPHSAVVTVHIVLPRGSYSIHVTGWDPKARGGRGGMQGRGARVFAA